MNCDRARELISDSLDGALAESAKAKFERHLGDCAPCRAFHAEMKESLLLLEELPMLTVDDRFDEAVWARLRTEEEPAGIVSLMKARLRAARDGEVLGAGFWKWSPVAVAATVLLMFAIASDPPAPERIADSSSSPIRPAGTEMARVDVPRAPAPSAVDEDVEAGIPDAIEKYLLNNARDLRISNDPDRFRRSNYSYPLRRVQDPSFFQQVHGSPVSEQVPVRRATTRAPETISF